VVELASLRGLAHALTRGDADAEDLLQDVALASLEQPPTADRPHVPWLIAVLRNRWRMNRRAEARRLARDAASLPTSNDVDAPGVLDRARVLQQIADALVALDEPFRTTVIRRYLDGESAADIARDQGVPAGTVRWRLHTGLARLRAALDAHSSRARWQLAIAPLAFPKGALIVNLKMKLALLAALLMLAALGTWKLATRHPEPTVTAANASAGGSASRSNRPLAPGPAREAPAKRLELPRAVVETIDAPGGVLAGRVINWSTGEGVAGAELTLGGDDGAVSLRTDGDGAFELAAPRPGAYTLTTIAAAGFLPYAPEYLHSPVRAQLDRGVAIRGVKLYLFPAVDYHGRVVDGTGAPVRGARVRLLGTPEQAIYRLATEWTSDKDGRFDFHAPDGAVFEATRGSQRGWAELDGKVALSHQLTIVVGDALARDASIAGTVTDQDGHPVADVLVTAMPTWGTVHGPHAPRAGGTAVTGSDGAFKLESLDRDAYDLTGEAEGFAPTTLREIKGGSHGVQLVLDNGAPLAGAVANTAGNPVPEYTLLAYRRDGAQRELVATRTIADPQGRFELRVSKGNYELVAAAMGWAPSSPTTAASGSHDVKITVSTGGTVRGIVHSAITHEPLTYARVMHQSVAGGASALPANTGTVTRADGTFELTGIPTGPFSLSVAGGGYHEHIESGLVSHDDGVIGPLSVDLTPIAPGEQPGIDLVGIGTQLSAERDDLRVERVYDGSGAQAAGIITGDKIIAVDGVPVVDLGLDGCISRIRGVEGTTVAITLRRSQGAVTLNVARRKLRA
jgi:RNA polymerase sigma factor (sigma-70 family)